MPWGTTVQWKTFINNAMKRLLITLLFLSVTHAGAQNWDEWFNQKKTQKKYLLEQIAALKVYLDHTRKGYKIVKGGLSTIGHIRNGEFGLHKDFFGALGAVSPAVRDYARVGDITRLQVLLVQEREQGYRALEKSGQLSSLEMQQVRSTHKKVLEESLADLDDLFRILTPGKLEMSDAGRLERIDVIYDSMLKRYRYLHHYNGRARQLAENRLREKADSQAIEIIH